MPEELVNNASPELALRFQRSRVNQPDPTFPQFPRIIFEISGVNLIRRRPFSVLSMNCQHNNKFFASYNELICTFCSPEFACEKT
jgi:hypothetical protein